jgi:hypothetical protein
MQHRAEEVGMAAVITRLLYKARLFDYARDVAATAELDEHEGVP